MQILDLISDEGLYYAKSGFSLVNFNHNLEPDLFPVAYPQIPGLLPWGLDDQGCSYHWWAEGEPETWGVAIDARSYLIRYDFGMLEFLWINIFTEQEDRFLTESPATVSEVGYAGWPEPPTAK